VLSAAARESSRAMKFIGICARSLFTPIASGCGLKHLQGVPTDLETQNLQRGGFVKNDCLCYFLGPSMIRIIFTGGKQRFY
jgi:hypothetical protein